MRSAALLAKWVATSVATWFGCGLSPVAPGTVGSLGALPLHLLLREAPSAVHAAAVAFVLAAGTWAAQRYASERGEKDPQRVVIDEVAGALLALGCVRHEPLWLQGLAFLLFRLFDIWKPGLIRRAEHLQPTGVGIMADDVLAGLCAGALAFGFARLA
ncbi:MAG: phosphatidylglycerophosphatase A [Deltaproteobacteria bacterium]